MGTNLSTLVNLSADNWAQHMTAAAATHSHHLPAAASMLTTGPLTTSTGVVHHHQPQYHPASMWNLNAATSPSCAMSQYLRTGAGVSSHDPRNTKQQRQHIHRIRRRRWHRGQLGYKQSGWSTFPHPHYPTLGYVLPLHRGWHHLGPAHPPQHDPPSQPHVRGLCCLQLPHQGRLRQP